MARKLATLVQKVNGVPRTMEEALEMGFEASGGSCERVGEDLTKERGIEDMTHPDGRHLSVPYTSGIVFGKPRLDRKLTKAAREAKKHPKETAVCENPIIVCHPHGVRVLSFAQVEISKESVQVVTRNRLFNISLKDNSISDRPVFEPQAA